MVYDVIAIFLWVLTCYGSQAVVLAPNRIMACVLGGVYGVLITGTLLYTKWWILH